MLSSIDFYSTETNSIISFTLLSCVIWTLLYFFGFKLVHSVYSVYFPKWNSMPTHERYDYFSNYFSNLHVVSALIGAYYGLFLKCDNGNFFTSEDCQVTPSTP